MDKLESAQLELNQWIIPILRREQLNGLKIAIDAESLAAFETYKGQFDSYADFLDKAKNSTIQFYLPPGWHHLRSVVERCLNTDAYYLQGKMKAKVTLSDQQEDHVWTEVPR